MNLFNHVAVGGTFDRLHKGHRELLETAFRRGRNVSIGITGERMVQDKMLSKTILSYDERKKDVVSVVSEKGWTDRATIVMLTDPLGPLTTDETIDALVVGPRMTEGIRSRIPSRIKVVSCNTILARDGGHLSSTRIRLGEIDRDGWLYDIPSHDILISEELRALLKKPLGILSDSFNQHPKSLMIVSVGDISTKKLLNMGIIPSIGIVDFYVQRKKTFLSLEDIGYSKDVLKKERVTIHAVSNPAGSVTRQSFEIIKQCFSDAVSGGKSVIVVDGEDDLLTLASLYLSPLSATIFYGQPNEGLVEIFVTEERKEYARKLVKKSR